MKGIFDKYGLAFWLDTGTLLGAIRDKGIIMWDTDVDLGVLESGKGDIFKVLLNDLRRKNFYVFYDEISDVLTIIRHGLRININFYKPMKAGYVYAKVGTASLWSVMAHLSLVRELLLISRRCHFNHRLKMLLLCNKLRMRRSLKLMLAYQLFKIFMVIPYKIRWFLSELIKILMRTLLRFLIRKRFLAFVVSDHHFKELDTINFYGTTFYIPSDSIRYLECHYGKDWRTPKKDWSWLNDNALKIISE